MSSSKSGGGKSKKSGGGKKSLKGQTDTKVVSKKMETDRSCLMLIRSCLFNDDGTDKLDYGLPPILTSKVFNGEKLDLTFHAKIPRDDFKTIFAMIKEGSEDAYDDSGYGWDDSDKKSELTERGGRYVIGRVDGEIRAFAHYRFTRAGECVYQALGPACVHLYDVVVKEEMRMKGVGKYLVSVITMIAKKEKLPVITFPVYEEGFEEFLSKVVKGGSRWNQSIENMFEEQRGLLVELAAEDTFSVYAKVLNPPFAAAPIAPPAPAPKPKTEVKPPAAPATSPPAKAPKADADAQNTSPTSVAGTVAPPAPSNKLATFDMSGFTDSLEGGDVDITEPTDPTMTEEDALLEALIEEFEKRNGREPTGEEMEQWKSTLTEASEQAISNKVEVGDGNEEVACE